MRILRLDLERFGHFRGKSISFASTGACIVRGQNEAGKTTALRAIHSLLFGFHDRSAHLAVGFEQSQLLVGARVEFASGAQVELRRRKGKRDTLTGEMVAGGAEVNEEWFKQRLHGATRPLFENVFAFSLDALARGAETLKQQEIAEALYGAAVGGDTGPHALLAALKKERESLFAEKGSRPTINAKRLELESLRARVRQETTDVERLAALEREVEAAQRAAVERHEALARVRTEVARRRAVAQGLDGWRRLRAATEELATIVVPSLPVESVRRHARLVEERARLDEEMAAHTADVARTHAELAATSVDARVLDGEETIDALWRGLEAHRSEAHDHTEIAARIEIDARELRRRLAEVSPGWDVERLRASNLDPAAVAELDARGRQDAELERDARATTEAIASHDATLEQLDEDLGALPATIDGRVAEQLTRWIDGWSGKHAEQQRMQEIERACAKLERARAATHRKLAPQLPADADIATLAVPRVELVDRHARLRSDAEGAIAGIDAKIADRIQQIEDVEAELAEIDAGGRVPSEDELRVARRRREEGWRIVLRALQREPTDDDARRFDGERPLPRAFEHATLAADEVADEMRRRADLVGRRALSESKLRRMRADLETSRMQRREAEARTNELHAAWVTLWTPCDIDPLDPAAMRAWLLDRDKLVEQDAQLADLRLEHDRLRDSVRDWTAEGRALLGGIDGTLDDLRAEARTRIGARRDRLERESVLRGRRAHVVVEAATSRQRIVRLQEERRGWNDAWRAAVRAIGVLGADDDALREPGRTEAPSVVSMRRRVDELRALREALHADDERRRTLESLGASIAEWCARATDARAAFAPDLASRDAPLVVERMHDRLRTAIDARRTHAERSRALQEQERRLHATRAAREQIEAELAQLRLRAGASDDDAFTAIARAVEHAAALRTEIERRTHDLRLLRGGWDEAGFHDALASADEEALREEIDRLAEEERTCTELARTCDQRIGETRKTLELVATPASSAADAVAESESVRASLRVDVERWAVLTVAEELLRGGIRRFERDHQPALLATASRLLATMTVGKWVDVKRPYEGGLVVVRSDGVELEPDQLSTGTREQLFLAIRLAYVDQYGRGAEPLPVVLDDVLVNFDPARAAATLEALATFAARTQVLLFTCHDHLADLARARSVDVSVVELAAAQSA